MQRKTLRRPIRVITRPFLAFTVRVGIRPRRGPHRGVRPGNWIERGELDLSLGFAQAEAIYTESTTTVNLSCRCQLSVVECLDALVLSLRRCNGIDNGQLTTDN